MEHVLSFPGLGIKPFTVNSIAFSIGKHFTVAKYGLIITLAIVLAALYVIWRAKQQGIKADTILDMALVTVPVGVVGARLYYVLTSLDQFVEPNFFKTMWNIINLRDGGLAIYGGILGGALGFFIMTRVKKVSFFQIADMTMPAVIFAQSLGRWGNFFNAEAYGYETTLPWRMGIHHGDSAIFVHPTFLYESLWNLLGFILINLFYGFKKDKTHKKYDGQIMLMVFGWYGFGRMLIEGLRTDSLYIFGIFRISQVLGLLFFLAAAGLLIAHHFSKTDMFFRPLSGKKDGKDS